MDVLGILKGRQMTDPSPANDSKSDTQTADAVSGRDVGLRPVSNVLRWAAHFFMRTDRDTHGYVPFLLWIMLLFGGYWFPATPFLDHVFNDARAPINTMFGTASVHDGMKTPANGSGGDSGTTTPSASRIAVGPLHTILFLPVSLVFWSWTNLALLCVMASSMGEVNRTAEEARDKEKAGAGGKLEPDYRTACTRAFFVYLFVLMNEIAVAGTLSADGGGDSYKRVAILASATCFLASYRPEFFRGLIGKFAAKDDGEAGSGKAADGDKAKTPPAKAVNKVEADERPDYDQVKEFAAAGETS